jgi:ribosome-binding factor A
MTSVIREEIMNWLISGFDYSHIVITDVQLTEAKMQNLSGKIRQHVGRALRLKYTPELRFQYDQGLEQADYIEELLRKT